MFDPLVIDVDHAQGLVLAELAGGNAHVELLVGEPLGDPLGVAGGFGLPAFVRRELAVVLEREDVEAAGRQGQSLIEDRHERMSFSSKASQADRMKASAQGVGPDADPGEEAALGVSMKFLRNDVGGFGRVGG